MSPLDDLAFFRQLAQSDSLTVTARGGLIGVPPAKETIRFPVAISP